MDFKNKVVVVTGADGNLGRAVARSFESAAANCVLVGHDQVKLTGAFGEDSDTRLLVAADLTRKEGAQAVASRSHARFGRIDILCNLAGGFRMGPAVHETPSEDWEAMFALNLHSVLFMAQAVIPGMLAQGSGKVVNVGAFTALRGPAAMGAYAASKSALARVTESMAGELRERGVNVNCVMPTILDTPENRQAMPDADPSRWVALDDLAAVILFLASENARAIHGASIPVTGLS